jgi:hypothetical protein
MVTPPKQQFLLLLFFHHFRFKKIPKIHFLENKKIPKLIFFFSPPISSCSLSLIQKAANGDFEDLVLQEIEGPHRGDSVLLHFLHVSTSIGRGVCVWFAG